MISNSEVVSHLLELARLSTLDEGSSNAFRVRAYETAARSVEGLDTAAAEMSAKELEALRGVGASTAAKIRELVDTGRIARLEELREKFPAEFVELTRVPGVGPKTALLLRDELQVHNIEGLKAAIEMQALRGLPGMGTKTEENIKTALDRLGVGGKEKRTPILDAMRVADDVVAGSVPGARGDPRRADGKPASLP